MNLHGNLVDAPPVAVINSHQNLGFPSFDIDLEQGNIERLPLLPLPRQQSRQPTNLHRLPLLTCEKIVDHELVEAAIGRSMHPLVSFEARKARVGRKLGKVDNFIGAVLGPASTPAQRGCKHSGITHAGNPTHQSHLGKNPGSAEWQIESNTEVERPVCGLPVNLHAMRFTKRCD
jgi:hypothetical protein